MPLVQFSTQLARHTPAPDCRVPADTVAGALAAFTPLPRGMCDGSGFPNTSRHVDAEAP